MKNSFPKAVPEIPVAEIDKSLAYLRNASASTSTFDDTEGGGIAGISKRECRIFLTNGMFREMNGNDAPILVWLNLDSKQEVDELHEIWKARGAKVD